MKVTTHKELIEQIEKNEREWIKCERQYGWCNIRDTIWYRLI
jgi:hypothetical protein